MLYPFNILMQTRLHKGLYARAIRTFGFAWFVRLGLNLEEGLDRVGLGGNDYDSPFFYVWNRGKGGWHTDVHWHFGVHIALFYRRGLVKSNS